MAQTDPALIVRVGANLDDLKQGLTAADGAVIAFATSVGDVMGDAIKFAVGELIKLAEALPEVVLHGSEVADIADNFQNLASQAGHLGDVLMSTLREGTHNTVDDFALMQRANKDLAAGLNLTDDQFGLLAKGAFALAQATGVDTAQALDTMSDALIKGKSNALALLTGKIDLKAAEEAYAEKLGATAADLTAESKLEADRAAMLQAVGTAVERLGEQTDGLDEKVAQAKVAWTNFLDELGKTIATSPVLIEAFDGIRDILVEVFGGSSTELVRTMKTAIEDMIVTLASWGSTAVSVVAGAMEGWEALLVVFDRVANGLLHVESAMLKAQLAALIVREALEPWNDWSKAISDVQAHIDGVQDSIAENKKAIEGHEAAEAKWAVRGVEIGQQFDALAEKLAHTRDETQSLIVPTKTTINGIEELGTAAAETAPKLKGLTEEEKALHEILLKINATIAKTEFKQFTDKDKERTAEMTRQSLANYEALKKLNDQYGLNADGTIKVASATDIYTRAMEKLNAEQNVGVSKAARAQVITDEYTKALYDEAVAQDAANLATAQAVPPTVAANASMKEYTNTLVLGIDNLEALNAALSDFYDQFAGSNVGTPGTGSYGTPVIAAGGGYRQATDLSSSSLARRAGGGPVTGGTPYVVGEMGPELFVPGTSGGIVPSGSGMVTNIYITQPLGSPKAIADAVGAAQLSMLQNRGERFRPSGV